MVYDVIIAGGGPAGLAAAVYALRAEKSVLVLEKNGFGGQIAMSPKVENYPGISSLSGAKLADNMVNQVLEKGGEIELCEVTGIEDRDSVKCVHTDEGDYEGLAVILATGARHRTLSLPREEELVGSGVSYCAVCDGAFYKGRPVAVAGGGNAALQDAVLLANSCSTVYIIHRRGEFRAEAANVSAASGRSNIRFVMNAEVVRLVADSELKGVEIETDGHKNVLPVDALFVAVGFKPENGIFKNVAELNEAGWFASDENCETRTPGIFVAGDCRMKNVRQLATAVGDGATAAVAACRYIDGHI